MRKVTNAALAAVAVATLFAACSSPTSSQPPVTMDAFAGTWTSGAVSGSTAGNPCTGVTYTITKTSDTSGTVSYSASCNNYTIAGTGKGTLNGSVLSWEAAGTASAYGGVSCSFSFSDSTATPQTDGILVIYKGTICGVPVSGQQVVHKH